jgi:ADP-ribose pyrophosphatase
MTKKIIAEGRHLRFVETDSWEYVERKKISGIVGILAVTPEGKLLLTEQFRRPLGRKVIELPAGLAGDVAGSENEKLAIAARRELLEETGYDASRFELLACGSVSAGLSDEIITLYRATGLKKVSDGGGDGDENITVHAVPLKSLRRWLKRKEREGAVVDLKVYAGLHFAR